MPHTIPPRLNSINILDMQVDDLDESACVQTIMAALAATRGGWVITSNLDILRRYVRDTQFRALAQGATLIVADGMPLIWASKLQGTRLPGRVAGSNLISTLSAAAASSQRSVFLLGGDPGTAEAAAAALCASHPGLRVAGTLCPPLGFETDPPQLQLILERVRNAAPDIVFVALGCPKQERVIHALRQALPHAWWLGIGISFSFLAGRVRRAPPWMQRMGLEWLHRLAQEPRRLAKRYLVDGIPFAAYMLTRSLLIGLRRRLGQPPRAPRPGQG